ncbi:FGGY-family carbohydrate kinase [Sediminispirochaeta smaragdinae]|uniref:Carbohydrate kinase, FGGY n=1 Tax=Sediminispirochaeta smaragdinae (strain DSM 11293 / JCM 15392 / SEBR 4228) TaxID=573413 RepID=E1R9W6_SEDSS|nr:FGGY-family carbohydrate kinase [Sediminispirochaeta smaragdinae]ADK83285.1 Carbohydrate kinase, FGGY [Sediminispirochaeta smaragdinae DSM 11293]
MSFLGIDIGTSGTTALLLCDSGKVMSIGSFSYSRIYPRAGYEEQVPDEIWNGVCGAIRQALREAVDVEEIRGVSMASQRGSFIPVDSRFRPLTNAIVWSDMRAKQEAEALAREIDDDVHAEMVGYLPSFLWTASKIRWFIHSYPKPEAVFAFCNEQEWIGHMLGADLFATAPSALTMNGMMDIRSFDWADTILDHIGITKAQLPRIEQSGICIGAVSASAAEATGLTAGTPIFLGGGDQQCAALGTGTLSEHDIHMSLGTGGAIVSLQKNLPAAKKGVIIGGHVFARSWDYETLLLSAGNGYAWLRKIIGSEKLSEIDAVLENERDGTDVLFFPFLAGQAEYGTSDHSTGVFWGIRSGSTAEDLAKAVMEGTADEIRMKLGLFFDNGKPIHVTGGCFFSDFWSRMIATKIHRPLSIPVCQECTALGAAMIAGVGSGWFSDYAEAVSQSVSIDRVIDPEQDWFPAMDASYERFITLYKKFQDVDLF